MFARLVRDTQAETQRLEQENARLAEMYDEYAVAIRRAENAYTAAFQENLDVYASLYTLKNIEALINERSATVTRLNQLQGRRIRIKGLSDEEQKEWRRLAKREKYLNEATSKYNERNGAYWLQEKSRAVLPTANLTPVQEIEFIPIESSNDYAWHMNFELRGSMSGYPSTYEAYLLKLSKKTRKLTENTARIQRIIDGGKQAVTKFLNATADTKITVYGKAERDLLRNFAKQMNDNVKQFFDAYPALREYRDNRIAELKANRYDMSMMQCIACNEKEATHYIKGTQHAVCGQQCAQKIIQYKGLF